MTFSIYCFIFCDDCQSTHLDKKCSLISKKKLKERVTETAVKVEKQLENQAEEINNIIGKCGDILKKEKSNETSQIHLYELIIDKIKELIGQKQDVFKSKDSELVDNVMKLQENLDSILKSHNNAIEKLKDISSQLGQDKIPKINALAETYKQIKNYFNENLKEYIISYKSKADEIQSNHDKESLCFQDLTVKEQLTTMFNKIHREGTTQIEVQSDPEFLCSSNPMSDILKIIEIPKIKTHSTRLLYW